MFVPLSPSSVLCLLSTLTPLSLVISFLSLSLINLLQQCCTLSWIVFLSRGLIWQCLNSPSSLCPWLQTTITPRCRLSSFHPTVNTSWPPLWTSEYGTVWPAGGTLSPQSPHLCWLYYNRYKRDAFKHSFFVLQHIETVGLQQRKGQWRHNNNNTIFFGLLLLFFNNNNTCNNNCSFIQMNCIVLWCLI